MKLKDIKIGDILYVDSPNHDKHHNCGEVIKIKNNKVTLKFGFFNCREHEFNPN